MSIQFVDLQRINEVHKEEFQKVIIKHLTNASFIGDKVINEFEDEFAAFLGISHCISCANGTDAIEIALEVLDIGPGDEVVVPAHTWISTVSAVVRAGAQPVFIDTDPAYYTMLTDNLEDIITSKTKAIIPVHLAGMPADMPMIKTIAGKYNLKVIEDCAQAHGAAIDKQKVGTFGDISTFSFYPGKNLGAFGDAGAICTNNPEIAGKCRMICNHGQAEKHDHRMIGRNSRMDSMQAAVLLVKLKYLDKWNQQRIQKADLYNQLLSDNESILQLPKSKPGYEHVYHLYIIQHDKREELKHFLEENSIHAQVHYPKILPALDVFKESMDMSKYKNGLQYQDRILSLPMHPYITDKEVEIVCEAVKNFLVKHRVAEV